MSKRILIQIDNLLDTAAGEDFMATMWRELHLTVDKINSALPDYECTTVHLDTANYISFTKHDPEEGAYGAELAEEKSELDWTEHNPTFETIRTCYKNSTISRREAAHTLKHLDYSLAQIEGFLRYWKDERTPDAFPTII